MPSSPQKTAGVPFRVGLDTTALNFTQAGAAVYIRGLLAGLDAVAPAGSVETLHRGRPFGMGEKKSLRRRLSVLRHDLLWNHVELPRLAARKGLDLIHGPAQAVPLRGGPPAVLTVLDTLVLELPLLFPRWQRLSEAQVLPRAARRARRVLAISRHVADVAIKLLDLDPARVVVTPCAAAASFRVLPPGEVEAFRASRGLGRFVLSVGALEPRKNLVTTLRALRRLLDGGLDVSLVHAGPKGWQFEPIFREVERLGLEGRVRFLGRVSEPELVLLYNAAAALSFPSLREGFGLPALEALACGCPVVASDATSIPEVVGEAALLHPPEDEARLADALSRVLTDPALVSRLRTAGLARAATFSWERCAAETFAAYGGALAG